MAKVKFTPSEALKAYHAPVWGLECYTEGVFTTTDDGALAVCEKYPDNFELVTDKPEKPKAKGKGKGKDEEEEPPADE